MNNHVQYKPYTVQASVFLAWWKRLNEIVANEPPEEGANLSDAVHRLELLRTNGERAGALESRSVAQPVTAESPFVGETLGLIFSTAPNLEFAWDTGGIDFGMGEAEDPDPEALIRDVVNLTGIPERS
jgi:hypothetical protein